MRGGGIPEKAEAPSQPGSVAGQPGSQAWHPSGRLAWRVWPGAAGLTGQVEVQKGVIGARCYLQQGASCWDRPAPQLTHANHFDDFQAPAGSRHEEGIAKQPSRVMNRMGGVCHCQGPIIALQDRRLRGEMGNEHIEQSNRDLIPLRLFLPAQTVQQLLSTPLAMEKLDCHYPTSKNFSD